MTPTTPPTSPRDRSTDPDLFTIHPVLREAAPPCGRRERGPDEWVVSDPDDEAPTSCLVLGGAAIDATAIDEAEIPPSGSAELTVSVQLDAGGNRALDASW